MQNRSSRSRPPVRPEQLLALGFLAVILIGGLILSLPVCASGSRSIGLRAGLFTATSAVCVTGLTLIDAGTQLSLMGQAVLLLLIELGGLGFMSFATVIMVALGRRVSLRGRMLLRDSMNQTDLRGMVRLCLIFFGMALLIESLGAMVLMTRLIPLYGVPKGIWLSFFTSISAFCNAGFDLFGNFQSLTQLQQEPVILLTLSCLIILGGLGFSVILECFHHRFSFRALSLHAKLVLLLTSILLFSGMLMTFVLEYSNTLSSLSLGDKLANSFFQSVTLRTAGFDSLNQSALTDTSKLLCCVWMFIGASSASTGGGIKTTTAFMMLMLVVSVIRGQERINVLGREIPQDTARRSMAIAFLGILFVLVCTCMISLLETAHGFDLIDILYETVSAFSTTGLSSLGTVNLRPASQWLLMPLMYLGRVGPLTLAFALASRSPAAARVRFPEEKIMIG